MDRNGSTDLVGVLQDGAIATFLNNGDGTFQAPVISPAPPEYSFNFYSAELRQISLNTDSLPDLAVLTSGMGYPAERKLLLFRAKNVPVGGFQLDTIYIDPNFMDIASGDLNGDGVINEVALSTVASNGYRYLKVLSIEAAGDITYYEFSASNPIFDGHNWITAGDFDGDGRTDIAMSGAPDGAIFLNRTLPGGELNLVAHTASPLYTYYWLSSGDLNGDGRDDIITNDGYTTYGDAHVLMMGPGGRIAYALRAPGCDMSQIPPGSGQHCDQADFGTAYTVVDVNNDGRKDIIGTVKEDDLWDQKLTVSLQDGIETGDLNCDNAVNFDDIDPFVLALTNAAGYGGQYPTCDIRRADVDGDSRVNFNDINPFIGLLALFSGSEPSEVSEREPKPIPTINPAQEPKLEVEPTNRTTIKSDGARKKVAICPKAKKKKGGKAKRRYLKTVI